MAAKRQRERKVVKLEELLSGKPMSLEERVRAVQRQSRIWSADRDLLMTHLVNTA